METYRYQKIDAFTAGQSLGNPAACLYLAPNQQLSPAQMLAVAAAHRGFVSEVVYCKSGPDGIGLTYYSAECEVDFCGHGTIACLYGLIRSTPALLQTTKLQITTHKKGALTVYNRMAAQDAVLITAPQPLYIGTALSRETVAAQLGLPTGAVDPALPVDLIDAGLRTLIVPLRDLEAEVSVFPGEQALKAFCLTNGIDIILIFTL